MYAVTAIDPADEAGSDQPRKRHRRPPAVEVRPGTPIWCPSCEAYRVAADFGIERRRYSGLKTRCRKCEAAARQTPEGREKTRRHNKARYAKPEYREKIAAAAKERRKTKGAEDLRRSRARLQAIVDAWKADGCDDCGYADIRAIDPDHLHGESKVGHVSRMVQLCASAARIRAELDKRVRRCARCHRRRTQQQRPNRRRTAARVPPSWQQVLDHQDRNDAVKMAHGCIDCGWREWARGLDWDHVRGRKTATISMMIANYRRPWAEIEAEMAKCDVVCANCHRIRTIERYARLAAGTAPSDQTHERRYGTPCSEVPPR